MSTLVPPTELTALEHTGEAGFPYRLAAIDIDDTLVGPDRIISDANRKAIARLRALDVHIVLASGRSHANMVPFHRELGLDSPLISANGALVREVASGEVWFEHGIPPELLPDLINSGRERGFSVLLYGLNGVYVDRRTPFTEYDQSRNEDIQVLVDDLLRVPADSVHKVIWMAEPAEIDATVTSQAEKYAGHLTVTHTDPPYLEFMPPGINKSTGLAAVAAHYLVEPTHVVAFGDGNNDVLMLRWAGMGIAMSHAKPAAKAAADFTVADAPVTESLARGIEYLLHSAGMRTR